MHGLSTELRTALRQLVRSPGFTAVVVLTLGLGIGATTAIFSVVNAVLLRPLPYQEPDRLVGVWQQMPAIGHPQLWFSEPEYFDYRERQQSFEEIAFFVTGGANLTGQGEPLRVEGAAVSAGFFAILGMNPLLGRTFAPEEDVPGNDNVVVLAHGLWQRRFGGDPEIVGKSLVVDGRSMTVIGVMPPGFAYPGERVEAWRPLALDRAHLIKRDSHFLSAIARLKPGMTPGQASADVNSIALQLQQEYPDTYPKTLDFGAFVVPLRDNVVAEVRPALLMLLGAVGFVLLIVCANVANLLLSRAGTREKEMAIRVALGAGRRRVVRQLLTESLLLALLGGGLGLVVALWGTDALVALSPDNIPRLERVRIDGSVLGFALGVSLLAGMLCGLAPALYASRPNLQESLKEGGRSSGGEGRQRLRSLLVIAEVALSVLLLVGAGLLVRSFLRVLQVDPGYQTENILTLRVSPPKARYAEKHQVTGFYGELCRKVASLPGVEAVGGISGLPLSGFEAASTVLIERPPSSSPGGDRNGEIYSDFRSVTPGYFRAVGIGLLQGRFFEESDTAGAPLVAIVDGNFAARAWPGEENPIGQRVAIPRSVDDRQLEWRTVVGVVGHTRGVRPDFEGREQIYLPFAQFYPLYTESSLHLAVHSAGDPLLLLGSIRSEVAALDPQLPIYDVSTMEQRLEASIGQRTFILFLSSVFAVVALLLAAVGIFGVVSYSASRRTREIGVRKALGARDADIFRLVVGQGMVLTVVGVSLGLAGALAVTRLLESLIYEVKPTDLPTFLGVSLLLAAVALLACYIPARRAAKLEPMVALRYE